MDNKNENNDKLLYLLERIDRQIVLMDNKISKLERKIDLLLYNKNTQPFNPPFSPQCPFGPSGPSGPSGPIFQKMDKMG